MRQNEKQVSNILDRAIMGDEEAFSFLYQENVKKIYNYIFYRTGNIHDAEDLTARVFGYFLTLKSLRILGTR